MQAVAEAVVQLLDQAELVAVEQVAQEIQELTVLPTQAVAEAVAIKVQQVCNLPLAVQV
jgi:hypothetical protein